jgi:dGTPase
VIRRLIDVQVEDALATSAANLAAADVRTVMDVRRHAGPLISHSPDRLPQNAELRRFLFAHLYDHPTVAAANERACARLADVFAAYLRSPEQLGVASVARIEEHGLHRTVCDYIAGMTDRYLLEAHARLFGSASGSAHEL